jgi:[ribosomal protein S5]-alanine N-acetyltransferase
MEGVLITTRLELRSLSVPLVSALLESRPRSEIEKIVGAELPWTWPSRALVDQAFPASLEAVRADPETRLWGDRLMVTREPPARVVGSILFHGRPGADGIAEVAFGVEDSSQGKGYATEALVACIDWALAQPECTLVRATTTDWHKASKRLLERVGMRMSGDRQDGSTRMLVYEKRR